MQSKKLRMWQVVGASVPGTSHEKREQNCQDFHYWKVLPEGILVAAVADGAGFAALSYIGAEIAARSAVEYLCSKIIIENVAEDESWRSLLINSLKKSQNSIIYKAEELNVNIRNFATTLILLVATPELISVAQVGDGAVVVGDVKGNVIALTIPDNGEYANETTFIISPNYLDTSQIALCWGAYLNIAVFSDGLQRLALKMFDKTPYKPFFSPLFKFVNQMEDQIKAKDELELFLRSKRLRERTSDDLTLLLANSVDRSCHEITTKI